MIPSYQGQYQSQELKEDYQQELFIHIYDTRYHKLPLTTNEEKSITDLVASLAKDYNRLLDYYVDNPDIMCDCYNCNRCRTEIEYFINQNPHSRIILDIKKWSDVVAYLKDYIEHKRPENVWYNGPIGHETDMIVDKLLSLFDNNIATTDSQPGLCYFTKNKKTGLEVLEFHKPYLEILCHEELADHILKHINAYKYMRIGKFVAHDIKEHKDFMKFEDLKEEFKNYGDNRSVCRFMFVVKPPANKLQTYFSSDEKLSLEGFREYINYFRYIFSQQFFSDVDEILKLAIVDYKN